MRRQPLSTLREISEINMTPLMDLTFILLITFIITFPLIEQGIAINLPKADAAELSEADNRTISLDAEGVLYLDEQALDMDALAQAMTDLGAAAPDTTVYVRADETLDYGKVMEVMKILNKAGISRMALVTQAEGNPAP